MPPDTYLLAYIAAGFLIGVVAFAVGWRLRAIADGVNNRLTKLEHDHRTEIDAMSKRIDDLHSHKLSYPHRETTEEAIALGLRIVRDLQAIQSHKEDALNAAETMQALQRLIREGKPVITPEDIRRQTEPVKLWQD